MKMKPNNESQTNSVFLPLFKQVLVGWSRSLVHGRLVQAGWYMAPTSSAKRRMSMMAALLSRLASHANMNTSDGESATTDGGLQRLSAGELFAPFPNFDR